VRVRVSVNLNVSECDLLHGACTDRIDVTISSSLPFSTANHHHMLSVTDCLVTTLYCCTVVHSHLDPGIPDHGRYTVDA
jgi:hypothetical protein